jgi:hypothetical protein
LTSMVTRLLRQQQFSPMERDDVASYYGARNASTIDGA